MKKSQPSKQSHAFVDEELDTILQSVVDNSLIVKEVSPRPGVKMVKLENNSAPLHRSRSIKGVTVQQKNIAVFDIKASKNTNELVERKVTFSTPKVSHRIAQTRGVSDKRNHKVINKEVVALIPEAIEQYNKQYGVLSNTFEGMLKGLYADINEIETLAQFVTNTEIFRKQALKIYQRIDEDGLEFKKFAVGELQTLLDRVIEIKRKLDEQKRLAIKQDILAFDALNVLQARFEPFIRLTPGPISAAQTLSADIYFSTTVASDRILYMLKKVSDEGFVGTSEMLATEVQAIATELKKKIGTNIEDKRSLLNNIEQAVQHAIEGLSMAYAT